MRWSIIRTIWFREMRDQMRDRRTLIMIVGLPLVLYPLLGFAVLQFAVGFAEKPSVIGIVVGTDKSESFPRRQPAFAGRSPVPVAALLSALALPRDDVAQRCGALALMPAGQMTLDYPALIDAGRFRVVDGKPAARQLRDQAARIKLEFLARADEPGLEQRKPDLILEAPADFFELLDAAEEVPAKRPALTLRGRKDDERARLALKRLTLLLNAWTDELKGVRLARRGLSEQFLAPYEVILPEAAAMGHPAAERGAEMIVRLFPLMLVMWSLAGALYPAVDLCAGEKERGTMETLLITPAGRAEIVLGKFLTIWIFSFSTALLNLLSMGFTTAQFATYLPHGGISSAAILWCVVLALPQAAFFSALALAIGAYARSSKEGQYYLMPLFVLTMPLVFLTLAPGVELNPLYAMVPVTGVALLMQRLMTAPTLSDIPWAYFVPVLFPIGVYSWLALRWAIEQFNREEVLFREAERLDILLWLKSLFRDKEPLPTTGQAFFGLALLIGLRWLSLGFGNQRSLEMQTIISELAFVATPALLMVLILNTHPGDSLYLRLPQGKETGLAVLLAVLLLPPMIGLTQLVVWWFPHLREGAHPLVEIMREIYEARNLDAPRLLLYLFAFALIPAVCEELAFRGFVLHGLHHGFRPRNAVLLSSFFFALFHLNVFLFVPTFVLGVVLGLLTVRTRSLLPAILFHLLHNSVLIGLIPLSRYARESLPGLAQDAWAWLIGLCLGLAAALVWWLYRKPYVELARQEAAERNRIQEPGTK